MDVREPGTADLKGRRLLLLAFVLFWAALVGLSAFLEFGGPLRQRLFPGTPEAVTTVNPVALSSWFWGELLGRMPPAGSAFNILVREAPGVGVLIAYLVFALCLPLVLALTVARGLARRMGRGRFYVFVALVALTGLLPLKVLLRSGLHLRWLIYVPEYHLYF